MDLMANIRLQGQASAQRLLRKLWPIRSWRRESCREGGAGAALPQVMRTRLAASAQVASVALPTITRSAMARKRKFDAALGSVRGNTAYRRFSLLWGWWYGRWLQPRCVQNHLGRR